MVEAGTENDGGETSTKGGRLRRVAARLWPRRRRWQVTLIVVVVLILALVAWLVWLRPGTGSSATTQYRTETVSEGTLKSTVSASGTLEPAQESELSFPASGTVSSVDVAVGDSVTTGETLATIDPSALKVALQSAQADLTAAQDSLTSLEDSSDSSAAAIAAAQATVTVKQNAVTQAQSNLTGATLTAPFDGVVAAVNIAAGDTTGSSSTGGGGSGAGSEGSDASSTTTSGTSSDAITVIGKGTFTVSTSVSASDVGTIKKGMQATITASGVTEDVFGTVSSVGVVATTSSGSSGSSTFPVTVKVTGTHTDLLPGSSVTVAITTKQLTNVLSVSTEAITTDNGSTYVQRLVNGKEVQTKVTLGAVIGQSTVITGGLSSGDQVVIASFRAARASGSSSARSFGGTGTFPAGGFGGGGEGFGGAAGGFPAAGGGQVGGR